MGIWMTSRLHGWKDVTDHSNLVAQLWVHWRECTDPSACSLVNDNWGHESLGFVHDNASSFTYHVIPMLFQPFSPLPPHLIEREVWALTYVHIWVKWVGQWIHGVHVKASCYNSSLCIKSNAPLQMIFDGKSHERLYIMVHLCSLNIYYPCCPTPSSPSPQHGGEMWSLPSPHPQGVVDSEYIYILDFKFTRHHIFATPMCSLKGMHKSMCPSTCKWLMRTEGIRIDTAHCIFTLHIIITMHLQSPNIFSPCCHPPATPSHGMKGDFGPYLLPFISWVGFIAHALTYWTLSLCESMYCNKICVLLKGMQQSKGPFTCTWRELLGLIH